MSNNDKIFDGIKTIQEQAYNLRYIANALSVVGNSVLADDIATIADNVEAGTLSIRRGYNAQINDDYNNTMEQTNKLMEAALTSIVEVK